MHVSSSFPLGTPQVFGPINKDIAVASSSVIQSNFGASQGKKNLAVLSFSTRPGKVVEHTAAMYPGEPSPCNGVSSSYATALSEPEPELRLSVFSTN